jgi:GTP-binding protein HflX
VDPHGVKLIEICNKIDALDEAAAARLREVAKRDERAPSVVSALTGEGVPGLLDEIERRLSIGRATMEVEVAAADGEGLHWLYEHTEVLGREDGTDGSLKLKVRVASERAEGVRKRFQEI